MKSGMAMAGKRLDGPGREAGQRRVEAMVVSAFAIASENMRARHRGPARAAFARQVAMYLARTRLGLSLTATGAFFGRDRTTGAHACRIVEAKRDDPRIDAIVYVLERSIENWLEAAMVKGQNLVDRGHQ